MQMTERPTSNAVRVYEAHGHEVVLRVQVAPIGDSKRVVGDRVVNRTPHVNDAHTALQEPLGIRTEVTMHPRHRSIEGLVDVHTLLQAQSSHQPRLQLETQVKYVPQAHA